MAKLNRTCIVCGRKYEYCSSCKEHSMLEPWHSIFHDNNCREIFNAVSMYEKDSDEVIKSKLDKCDLSNKNNFHKNIINVIDKLYSSEKNIEIITEETVVEEIDEKNTVEVSDVKEEIVETECKEISPIYKNRNKK